MAQKFDGRNRVKGWFWRNVIGLQRTSACGQEVP